MSVFWTRGYRREGSAVHLGLVVVRPGWVAFLPIGGPMSAMDQAAMGTAKTRTPPPSMQVQWQGRYPINAWWQHGAQVFDEEVRRALAQPSAVMLTPAEAGRVQGPLMSCAFATIDGKDLVTTDLAPPPDLLAPWPPGVLPLDRKSLNKFIAIMCTVLGVWGAGCEALVVHEEGWVHGYHLFPLVFFGGLIAFALWSVRKRVRDHERQVAAQAKARDVGPYR